MLTKADIDWLRSELIPEMVKGVTQALGKKIDKMYTKLDGFVGDIKARREEQALHENDHERIDRRLNRLEKQTKLAPIAD